MWGCGKGHKINQDPPDTSRWNSCLVLVPRNFVLWIFNWSGLREDRKFNQESPDTSRSNSCSVMMLKNIVLMVFKHLGLRWRSKDPTECSRYFQEQLMFRVDDEEHCIEYIWTCKVEVKVKRSDRRLQILPEATHVSYWCQRALLWAYSNILGWGKGQKIHQEIRYSNSFNWTFRKDNIFWDRAYEETII